MGPRIGGEVCSWGKDPMKRVATAMNSAVTAGQPKKPRVRLQRINCDLAKPYPPDGQGKEWWGRLKKALGTTSSDFVNATLIQLQLAAQLPGGGLCEMAINSALSTVESAQPRNEIEAIAAIQLACCHAATMALFARVRGAHEQYRTVAALMSAAAKLVKASAVQMEMLRRLQGGSSQHLRVEHVYIHQGAQAVIGDVKVSRSACSPH
jgi:hypothetical protein